MIFDFVQADRTLPAPVRALAKHRVRHVACGWAFGLCSTHTGDAYSWGANDRGQLGHGDTRARLVPTFIESIARRGGGNTGGTSPAHPVSRLPMSIQWNAFGRCFAML